jgi:hypothetical protein
VLIDSPIEVENKPRRTPGRSPDSRIVAPEPPSHPARRNSGIEAAGAPRLQWRGRAGFSPASLIQFHAKQIYVYCVAEPLSTGKQANAVTAVTPQFWSRWGYQGMTSVVTKYDTRKTASAAGSTGRGYSPDDLSRLRLKSCPDKHPARPKLRRYPPCVRPLYAACNWDVHWGHRTALIGILDAQ